MEFWQHLFSGSGFMPRRFCGIWDPGLVQLHVVSDVVIWLSYLWIPMVMLWAYRRHSRNLRLHKPTLMILLLYVVFITACGWTHFFDALMFWDPIYRANGLVRAVTAGASLATAVSLVRLVPQAITAPITILTQQAAIRQQQAWLRDILDSATGGRLQLAESARHLPMPLGNRPRATLDVSESGDLARARRLVEGVAAEAGFDRLRTAELVTAAHEAVMNGLKHGHAATVRGHVVGETVQVWVEDAGPGIPLDCLPIATLKQGFSTAGTAGQGWFMILSFVDTAHLLTGPRGTTVVLTMHRIAPGESLPFSASVGGDVLTA